MLWLSWKLSDLAYQGSWDILERDQHTQAKTQLCTFTFLDDSTEPDIYSIVNVLNAKNKKSPVLLKKMEHSHFIALLRSTLFFVPGLLVSH